ncbi:ATP-binding protein [Sulfitobacter sabulilitoris]|uniref:histidine kinase n=1 Tax=Sulfitobacter sabulilitoris TaxID=2562655 RepID=A0A5S3PK82_9RHOB|nr:ATP-binding protein [Sulfitobacter sabulilitoris]TMM54721.1 ATPase [Sulfitobacter sabulilitoris]
MFSKMPPMTQLKSMAGSTWLWLTFALAVASMALVAYRLDRLSYVTYLQRMKSDTTMAMMDLREDFEAEIFDKLLMVRELAAIIGQNPDMTQSQFAIAASQIRGRDDLVINIAAAEDLKVSLVYPRAGNANVLGFDYRDSPEQLPLVEQVMRTGVSAIAAPVNLVQGGRGIIVREAVYRPSNSTVSRAPVPWGVVSIVIDYEGFIDRVGLNDIEDGYDILIREASQAGQHRVFFGSPALTQNDPVRLDFNFPFGNWQLLTTTDGGWPAASPTQTRERLIMAAVAALLMGLLSYVLWLSEARKLAQRRLSNGIDALDDGFVMFDADDRLVACNAKYREIYDFSADLVKPGTRFEDIVSHGMKREFIDGTNGAQAITPAERAAARRDSEAIDIEQHLLNGRVIKVSDRRMRDGSYVGLRVDISELTRARTAAEAASKAKTDFMGVLSHELRTPLTVILGVARLVSNARLLETSKALKAALEDPETTQGDIAARVDDMYRQLTEIIARMERSGSHLLHLINDMLDFAKIEAGHLSVDCSACDVSSILEPVAEQARVLAGQKGLEVQIDDVSPTLAVLADPVRARQILLNLVSNAVKFTDSGSVALSVAPSQDQVVFTVTDTGVGIPEDVIGGVFDPFYQVDSTATRRSGGTGLGLAISRELAMAQSGSLSAESQVGKGSSFTLTLRRSTLRAVA